VSCPPTIFLIRHASPDWDRKDIPYDIPPGPPLTPKGKQEAQALGVFLKSAGLKKLYYSPLERSVHTAHIAAAIAQIPATEQVGLAEWRIGETETEIQTRFWPLLTASLEESTQVGPVGLVTHGGPIASLLKQLGIDPGQLETHCRMFGHFNPLPPAGCWIVEQNSMTQAWDLQLVFVPLLCGGQ
jgi:broad specificity phosphatase PhoE